MSYAVGDRVRIVNYARGDGDDVVGMEGVFVDVITIGDEFYGGYVEVPDRPRVNLSGASGWPVIASEVEAVA
jgi:hypothetical protein